MVGSEPPLDRVIGSTGSDRCSDTIDRLDNAANRCTYES